MDPRTHADMLLRKAAHDTYVLDRLKDDARAPAEVFGFHAQQAVEKMLKAVLAAAGVAYPRTHRLAELFDLVRSAGIDVPQSFDHLIELSPYAVELRYGLGAVEEEPRVPMETVYASVQELRRWVETTVDKLIHGGGS